MAIENCVRRGRPTGMVWAYVCIMYGCMVLTLRKETGMGYRRVCTMVIETRADVRALAEILVGMEALGVHPETKSELLRTALELLADILRERDVATRIEDPEVAMELLQERGLVQRPRDGVQRDRRTYAPLAQKLGARDLVLDHLGPDAMSPRDRELETERVARKLKENRLTAGKMRAGVSSTGSITEEDWAQAEAAMNARLAEERREHSEALKAKIKEAYHMTDGEFSRKEADDVDAMHKEFARLERGDD